MGNAFSYSCSACQEQEEISMDIMQALEGMQSMGDIEELIAYIDGILSNIRRGGQEQIIKPTSVDFFINSGRDLTKTFSKRLNRHISKKCLLSALDRRTTKVVCDLASQALPIPYVGMAFSIIGHLLERSEQVSSNNENAIHLLRSMSALAKHMKNLEILLHRPKLEEILCFIVKATLMCALRMEPIVPCRFIFAPVDAADVESLQSQLDYFSQNLALEAVTALWNTQPNVAGPSQGEYPHNAVGINEAQNKVIQLLNLKDPSRRVVVIYGVGGIGKTTLASAVFNRLDLTGYHYCRVDMDQDSRPSAIPPLQDQILHDVFKRKLKLNSWTQGQEKLSEAFREASQPVFLFIDNALSKRDLEMLLPIQHLSLLPLQSRFLVTTRNLSETKIFEQDGIQVHPHKVDSLSEGEAKRILCHYALGDKSASFDPGVNMDDLLRICGGIPLVLGIVGSHLHTDGKTVSASNEIIKYYKDWQQKGFEGGEEISERMVDFVYRRLKEPCKEAFLDVALFFHDWERSKVVDIVGEVQLQDLERAALITTCEENVWEAGLWLKKKVVKMDDIVRGRGRKLSGGNRIRDRESLSILLSDPQRLPQTKGIWLPDDDDYEELNVEAKHVDLMSKSLRVLFLGKHTRVNGRCGSAFEDLRFLHISCKDMLPIDLSKSKQLVYFEGNLMKEHRISEANFAINLPESSRLLHLFAAEDSPVSLDIYGHLTSLRELQLSGSLSCLNILALYEGFENLCSLQDLNMNNCSILERIPESFGYLSSLQTLRMDNCSKLEELPGSFGNLSAMRELNMNSCFMLERLPENFGNLSSSQILRMGNCSKLEGLPESFGNLSSMRDLSMNNCSMLNRLPDSFGNLSSLQILRIDNCSKLEGLPESFGNLSSMRDLNMNNCSILKRLPESFGNLCSLQILRMDNCSKLEELSEGFGNLSSLQGLHMNNCSILERIPKSFGNLSSLQTLRMDNCSKLEKLPETFHQLSCLVTLTMDGCEKMCSLSENFGHLNSLKYLNISNCKKLKSLSDDFVCSTSLAAMRAYGCIELEAKAMDILVEIQSLMFLEMGESPILRKRWEQIQQHRPLIGSALRFESRKYPYEEILSSMFFNVGSRFLQVEGNGKLAEMGSRSFPCVGMKVGLLLTASDLSDEVREKVLEVSSREFQIIYVDMGMEAEGSSWIEERDKRLRKRLEQLPEGSRAWTSVFKKTSLLFAFSLWHFVVYANKTFKHHVDSLIVGMSVLVDEGGRRKLSYPCLEMIHQTDGCDARRVDFLTLFSPQLQASLQM